VNRPDQQVFAKQIEQLNLNSSQSSPVARKKTKKMEPTAVSFQDFTKGIRESVNRLNPRSVSKGLLNYERKNRASRSPPSPKKERSRSKSASKNNQVSAKKHKQHEKRLEKLQKLRKSMKNVASPRYQTRDQGSIIQSPSRTKKALKKPPPGDSDQKDYKIVTQDKSCFDIIKRTKSGRDLENVQVGTISGSFQRSPNTEKDVDFQQSKSNEDTLPK
jgi:hypothetical protein